MKRLLLTIFGLGLNLFLFAQRTYSTEDYELDLDDKPMGIGWLVILLIIIVWFFVKYKINRKKYEREEQRYREEQRLKATPKPQSPEPIEKEDKFNGVCITPVEKYEELIKRIMEVRGMTREEVLEEIKENYKRIFAENRKKYHS